MSACTRRNFGFTLIELLIVIVILGVMAALVGQNFNVGSDTTRVRTATRGVLQVSRYARTMALLHQTPVTLTFTTSGKLSVKGAGDTGGNSFVTAKAFAATAIQTSATGDVPSEDEAETNMLVNEPDPQSAGGSGGASYTLADLDFEKSYEGIAFQFLGFTDSFEPTASDSELMQPIEDGTNVVDAASDTAYQAVVRYNSNGTCRPYKVKVTTEAGNEAVFSLTVIVSPLGSARVEEDEEK